MSVALEEEGVRDGCQPFEAEEGGARKMRTAQLAERSDEVEMREVAREDHVQRNARRLRGAQGALAASARGRA